MLPVLRLLALTLVALLLSTSAAQAAKDLSVAVPAEGEVAVAVASGAKSVKVKTAPAGVTVTGGVKKGRLAVAIVRPRGACASGKVVFKLKGRAKGVKTYAAALTSGRVSAGCADLAGLLGKRLKGNADVKALGAALAAKLCGEPAPGNAAAVLAKLGLGAPAPPAPPAPPAAGAPSGSLSRPGSGSGGPRPTPTVTPAPTATPVPGKRVCDNKLDDDGDGQTDWEDPGCADAGDATENSEVPASAECAATSGIGMADDPTELSVGINPGCGLFWEAEIQVAPGVAACTSNNGYTCEVYDPVASAHMYNGQRDAVDVTLQLKGPVDCSRKATIALNRIDGHVTELQTFVHNCRTLPPPAPKCANGKDDDGDGMTDSRDTAGTTDPDPGCTSAADTTENSETPTPATCEVTVGVFDQDPRLPGLSAEGCGVITGVWFRPPGDVTGCLFRFGSDPVQNCVVKAGTAGATFGATNQSVLLAAPIADAATCRPVTVALTREDGSVMADRVNFC